MKLAWPRKLRIDMASLTDKGLVRASNEDFAFASSGDDVPPWALAVAGVLDGVGGFPSGEEASSRAARYFHEELQSRPGPSDEHDLRENTNHAILSVHERLLIDGWQSPKLRGMATTATVAIVSRKMPYVMAIGQVGDGAAFLLRDRQLARLTPTDALPAEPQRWDQTTGGSSPWTGNRISQALGHRVVVPHVKTHKIRRGDLIVLGTDGLVGKIDTGSVFSSIADADPHAACQILVDASNAAGGLDNIGVVVIKFT